MMVIVKLRREHEGKVVSGMVILHLERNPTQPNPRDRNGGRAYDHSGADGKNSGNRVLDGVRIFGGGRDRGLPFMMLLVDVFV